MKLFAPAQIFVTRVIFAIIALQIGFVPTGFALKVQMQSDVKLRGNANGSMDQIGVLRKGTIIEIPDAYTVLKNGQPNLELTLNNWLRAGGLSENDDYYFPIRISQPAPGSSVSANHQKSQHFVALKYLARKGAALTVAEDAPLYTPRGATARNAPSSPAASDSSSELAATTPCADGRCGTDDPSRAARGLFAAVAPALSKANQSTNQLFQRTNNDLRNVYDTFQNNCGFSLSEFIPIVKARARQAGIPAEILLALLTQENSGRCYRSGNEPNGAVSVGLFQVNAGGGKYPMCSAAQIRSLRSIGHASRLATGPRCLDNPLINLEAAISHMKESRRILTTSRGGFDGNRVSQEDMWRLIISGYNGGVDWVLKAKQDVDSFNEIHGTTLDPHKWEDLRIFYMRSWLNRDQREAMLGSSRSGRAKNFAVSNLAYTENIMGRSKSHAGLYTAWSSTVRE